MEKKLLTKEEFLALALNPPVKERETLFVLTQMCIEPLEGGKRQHYPKYGLYAGLISYHRSAADAEKEMRRQAEEHKLDPERNPDVFCYYLREFPYSQATYRYGNVSCRTYDKEGNLLVASRCSDLREDEPEYRRFFGRPKELVRFKKGDIIEYIYRGKAALGVIALTPLTPQQAWEQRCRSLELMSKRTPSEEITEEHAMWMCPDYSEDCYVVIDGPSHAWHSHVHVTDVFAPHFPIPPYMRRRYEKYYEKVLKKINQ